MCVWSLAPKPLSGPKGHLTRRPHLTLPVANHILPPMTLNTTSREENTSGVYCDRETRNVQGARNREEFPEETTDTFEEGTSRSNGSSGGGVWDGNIPLSQLYETSKSCKSVAAFYPSTFKSYTKQINTRP